MKRYFPMFDNYLANVLIPEIKIFEDQYNSGNPFAVKCLIAKDMSDVKWDLFIYDPCFASVNDPTDKLLGPILKKVTANMELLSMFNGMAVFGDVNQSPIIKSLTMSFDQKDKLQKLTYTSIIEGLMIYPFVD